MTSALSFVEIHLAVQSSRALQALLSESWKKPVVRTTIHNICSGFNGMSSRWSTATVGLGVEELDNATAITEGFEDEWELESESS